MVSLRHERKTGDEEHGLRGKGAVLHGGAQWERRRGHFGCGTCKRAGDAEAVHEKDPPEAELGKASYITKRKRRRVQAREAGGEYIHYRSHADIPGAVQDQ